MSQKSKECYTEIVESGTLRLEFQWHINEVMLHNFYFKHFTNAFNCQCMSDIVWHKPTNTKWSLLFMPKGDCRDSESKSTKNNEASIYLMLQNKPSNISEVTINSKIICHQRMKSLERSNLCFKDCIPKSFSKVQKKKSKKLIISDLKNKKELTFTCIIDIVDFQKTQGFFFFF